MGIRNRMLFGMVWRGPEVASQTRGQTGDGGWRWQPDRPFGNGCHIRVPCLVKPLRIVRVQCSSSMPSMSHDQIPSLSICSINLGVLASQASKVLQVP